MSMSSPNQKKVVWAVDVFSEDSALNMKAARIIKAWTKNNPAVVEPVYVMSPNSLQVPPDAFYVAATESKVMAKKKLDDLIKKTKLTAAIAPHFLESLDFSLRNAVSTFLTYARESKASLIVASTQSKKGLSRFFFGSFAESLVLYSEIPVLLVSPHTVPSTLKHVLFATDLSEKSKAAFQELLREAETQKFEITIYNKVEYMTDYSVGTFASTASYQNLIERDFARRKAEVASLAEDAKRRGIKATGITDNRSGEVSPVPAILKRVKNIGADTIAMGAQSGPIVSAILGSVTRQVIRQAKCPVWVIHPQGGTPAKSDPSSNSQKKGAIAV
jgi:nucleotide-binding universal stress UspA family protein